MRSRFSTSFSCWTDVSSCPFLIVGSSSGTHASILYSARVVWTCHKFSVDTIRQCISSQIAGYVHVFVLILMFSCFSHQSSCWTFYRIVMIWVHMHCPICSCACVCRCMVKICPVPRCPMFSSFWVTSSQNLTQRTDPVLTRAFLRHHCWYLVCWSIKIWVGKSYKVICLIS